MRAALKDGVTRLAFKLEAKVKGDKLSDQVLHVRTGRLRRSINTRIEQQGSSVIGYVGTNVVYAKRQEYGFVGTETVRQHLRMMTQAFGKPVKDPHKVEVKAHARKVNYPAHSFLRSALADMDDEIRTKMEQLLNESANKVFGR